jgi:hypothetical protein
VQRPLTVVGMFRNDFVGGVVVEGAVVLDDVPALK